MSDSERPAPPIRAALAAGAVAFIAYALTSPPGITWAHSGDDGPEFAAVAAVLGVAHPTGYPLYSLLLRIAGLGAAAPAWRATLLTSLTAAGAIFWLTLLLFEVTRRAADLSHRAASVVAAGGALLFAFTPVWWSQSDIIEVYALHLFFVILILYLGASFDGEPRHLWITAYVAGLALAHHMQTVLLAPSVLVLVLAGLRRRGRWKALAWAPLWGAIPITLYLVLFLRSQQNPPLDWGNPESLKQLWWVIHGAQYRFRMFTARLPAVDERLFQYALHQFPAQFAWTALPLGLVGLVALVRRRATALVSAILLYIWIQLIFTINYAIPDPDAYFIPVTLMWSVAATAGIAALVGASSRVRPWAAAEIAGAPNRVRPWVAAALVVMLAGPVIALPGNWRKTTLRRDTEAEDYARDVMSSLPHKSIILCDGDGRTFSFWYGRIVHNRPDVDVIYRSLMMWPWYLHNIRQLDPDLKLSVDDRPIPELARHVITENLDSRDVFTNFDDRWLGRNFRVAPEGRVYRVRGPRDYHYGPDGPVVWKEVDLSGAANADYRVDPFTPGAVKPLNLYPGLGGGALYWGTLPLMVARLKDRPGAGTVITTAHQPSFAARLPLHADPTRKVVLLLDGGGIGRAWIRLGEARVVYATGPPTVVEIRSYENVWDFHAESFEVMLPEDLLVWQGPLDQSLTALPINTDPERTPVALELTGEGPAGESGEAAGYTVFAVTQLLVTPHPD